MTEGQNVKKGDLLIAFDLSDGKKRHERLKKENAMLEEKTEAYSVMLGLLNIDNNKVNTLHKEIVTDFKSNLALKENEIERLQVERRSLDSLIDAKRVEENYLEIMLIMKNKQAFENEQTRQLEIQKELASVQQDIKSAQIKIESVASETAKVKLEIDQYRSGKYIEWRRSLGHAHAKLVANESALQEIKQLLNNEQVFAADDGVITTLLNIIPGTWVEPGKPIMSLEKSGKSARVKANVPIDHLTWARIANESKVIFSEFPENNYGHLIGEYRSYNTEIQQEEGKGEFYEVYMDIKDNKMKNLPKDFGFFDGQNVSIVFGRDKRTILSYALNPITRGMHKTIVDPHLN
ncbi:hypothetical protein AT251_24545 [Enterovibrio nigricans]|nr:HlyD family efflux transporter periplasmic adaptor subunit [Enterovibrio nigricans]PKF48649.1 hypothetical protein AT251_24545 [Enterovibrio nigricans]